MARDPIINLAEHQVYEREQRVLRQKQLIAELELAGRSDAARTAREMLATLTRLLEADKAHLEVERHRETTRDINRLSRGE